MDDDLAWGHLLAVLRALRGWTREELAAAAGVSPSAIAEQEQGIVTPWKGIREKLEEALGVAGRSQELQRLGELRAEMLGRRYQGPAIEQAGVEAKRIMESALRLGLDQLRRMGSGDSLEGATLTGDLGWPILLRTLRTLRGWSREELAAALGLTSSLISKQESGERRPTRATREKVEQVLRLEGRMVEIELFLAELRASMLDPARWSFPPFLEEAGEETRRLVEAALRVGLEDLRSMEEDSARPWGVPPDEED